jgi:hypothetical protein
MWSTDRMSVYNSALADGPHRDCFVAHDFSSLNDRLTDNHGHAGTNEAHMFETPVFGGLHFVSTPPTVSTPTIPSVMPSTNCQETVVSRSAQLLSHAMTLLETNHNAWCCLHRALTLLRGHLPESPANAASAAGVRQRGLARWQSRAAIEYINANLASCVARRQKAFPEQMDALLEISNIHHIDAIVPCNARVPNSPSPSIPEQEILLNRGNTFTVLENLEDDAGRRVLRIEAIAATS